MRIGGTLGKFFFSKPGIDFHEIAVGVFKPEFVQWRTEPCGARRCFDVPSGRTGEVIGGNYRGLVRNGDPKMVERIVVQFLAVGDEQNEVEVQVGSDKRCEPMRPFAGLNPEKPCVKPGAAR